MAYSGAPRFAEKSYLFSGAIGPAVLELSANRVLVEDTCETCPKVDIFVKYHTPVIFVIF